MASYLWRKYADYVYTKWERTILWDMVDPYRRPKSFKPLVTIYVAAFYTGVIGSAITEQLHKYFFTKLITWKLIFPDHGEGTENNKERMNKMIKILGLSLFFSLPFSFELLVLVLCVIIILCNKDKRENENPYLHFVELTLPSGMAINFVKEKYWEDHPGEAVPLMQPKFYYGPWRIIRGEALTPNP